MTARESFAVGDKVLVFARYDTALVRVTVAPVVVEKIHKGTGNLCVHGMQFLASGEQARYGPHQLVHVDSEHAAECQRQLARQALFAKIRHFGQELPRICQGRSNAQLTILVGFLQDFEARPKEKSEDN